MNEDKLCFSLKMIKKHINYALDLSDDKYKITGYNLLPMEIGSAFGNEQLNKFPKFKKIFRHY